MSSNTFLSLFNNDDLKTLKLLHNSNGKKSNLNFTQFLNAVNNLSSHLKQCFFIKKGMPIASLVENNFYWSIIELAILKIGCVHVPLIKEQSNYDIQRRLCKIECKNIIVDSKLTKNRLYAINFDSHTFNPEKCLKESEKDNLLISENLFETKKEDIATILFTTGSTRISKPVAISHYNLLLCYNEFKSLDFIRQSNSYLSLLHHSFSGGRKVYYSFLLSGKTIYHKMRTKSIIENILHYKPDTIAVVPHMLSEVYNYLMEKGRLPVKYIISGGAELPKSLHLKIQKHGIHLINVYGLTETCSLGSYNTLAVNKPGSVGKLSNQFTFKFSPDNELMLKGEIVSPGYIENNKILKVTDEDGYLNTKDIAYFDKDGFLFITGRNDTIKKNSKGVYVSKYV